MPDDGDLLIHNIGELATLEGGVRRGDAMRDLGIHRNVGVLLKGGRVAEVGDSDALLSEYRGEVPVVNAGGRAACPGFVDAHTHAVFGGDRVAEFTWKLQGQSYQEIMAKGGGIHSTVRMTRESTRAELLKQLLTRLDRVLDHGTTCVEVKTGYGLDKATELLSLDVIEAAAEKHPLDIVSTFMAAHAVPPEFESDMAFVEHVIKEILPEAAHRCEFVDVFCEEGVFSVESSRRMLEAAKEQGLRVKLHADELAHSGGSQLAAEVGAVSADHLLMADDADRKALVDAGVIPVLLPGTAFVLREPYADARALIEAGAPVAVATDLNPNCYTESMPFAIALACLGMRMTPAEAITAATINGAAAVGRDHERGSLEEGKVGDLVLFDAPTLAHVAYRPGVNLVWKVVKDGNVVVDFSDRRF